MSNFSLALEFDTNNSEFCRGVEIGRIWEMLKSDDEFVQTIHTSNVEMIMRMMEQTERKMVIEDSYHEDWCYLTVDGGVLV